jgi:hypothetical protein
MFFPFRGLSDCVVWMVKDFVWMHEQWARCGNKIGERVDRGILPRTYFVNQQ